MCSLRTIVSQGGVSLRKFILIGAGLYLVLSWYFSVEIFSDGPTPEVLRCFLRNRFFYEGVPLQDLIPLLGRPVRNDSVSS